MMPNCHRFILSQITGQLERVPSRQAVITSGDPRAASPSALVNRGQLVISFVSPNATTIRDDQRSLAQVRP